MMLSSALQDAAGFQTAKKSFQGETGEEQAGTLALLPGTLQTLPPAEAAGMPPFFSLTLFPAYFNLP
ncbi:MAG: hypothetical protein A2075_01845 [Geobacteraceae bacterium GWC2_58_44]|nr:MAG: hypothetical protein A2075_01845 [Geobacteraceae bacterium GWC2_58_44]HBG04886.1 hypothetical protein [Geobacter sp.]